mmetsp:Transcript_12429/g.30182  ORF Transcript_12429/g.30182 Transcript_12429/m.30182 type:complete len:247 (-) Transcript_12429:1768-2508(-)
MFFARLSGSRKGVASRLVKFGSNLSRYASTASTSSGRTKLGTASYATRVKSSVPLNARSSRSRTRSLSIFLVAASFTGLLWLLACSTLRMRCLTGSSTGCSIKVSTFSRKWCTRCANASFLLSFLSQSSATCFSSASRVTSFLFLSNSLGPSRVLWIENGPAPVVDLLEESLLVIRSTRSPAAASRTKSLFAVAFLLARRRVRTSSSFWRRAVSRAFSISRAYASSASIRCSSSRNSSASCWTSAM